MSKKSDVILTLCKNLEQTNTRLHLLDKQVRCSVIGHNFHYDEKRRITPNGTVLKEVEYDFLCNKCGLFYWKAGSKLTVKEKKCVDSCFVG